MTSYPLAVFVDDIGARTETFIRRHMLSLLPGRTVSVGRALAVGHDVDWTPVAPFLDLDRVRDPASIKAFFREHGVEAFMGEYLDATIGWLPLVREVGSKFFGHAHGYDVTERLRDPHWRAEYCRYEDSDGIITMSEVSRTALMGCGLSGANIHVIPYGVDVPAVVTERGESTPVRLLAVGRMIPKKAPLATLTAFHKAARIHPAMRLDFVGNGELLADAQRFVDFHELAPRVTLHGSLPNPQVQHMHRRADIFVQHSMVDPCTGNGEGLPVAILEAMAHGLPVVATRHAGIGEAVVDGITGYLVEEGDVDGMGERLAHLAGDADERHRMGIAGWQRAKDRFSWDREREALLRVLGLVG